MSNLIVVDDQQIRKTAFSAVDRLLKKLQRMELNLETFHQRDQTLFSEWFNLTFREPREELDRLRGEYRSLAEFHNWMHAMAEMDDISLPHAAVLLREEERLMREGSEIDRAEILRRRRLRDDYASQAHERASRRDDPPTRAHAPDSADIDELEVVESLSDEELEDWCADEQVAFVMVGKALRLATYTGNYQLFFRLWDVLHPNVQRQFSKKFEQASGESLFDVIAEMRAKFVADGESAGPGSNAGAGPGATDHPRPQMDTKANANETFKLIYRQLARKLHPDTYASETATSKTPDWRAKMWLRVQAAYQEDDHEQMTRLFHLVLLRGKEFNDLRLSDLHQTHEYLADEIGQTEEYIRSLRRTPAWGFSRRKDTKPIENKLGRQLAKERRVLEEQVSELRVRHAFLERMGRADTAKSKQRRRRG